MIQLFLFLVVQGNGLQEGEIDGDNEGEILGEIDSDKDGLILGDKLGDKLGN